MSITELQAELRFDWKSSAVVQLDENVLPLPHDNAYRGRELDWFVLNDQGKATVIPSYSISDRAWNKAFFLNPLEVDWMRFEVHDTLDMDYLVSAIEVLQDMQDFWINDIDTRDQSLMREFTLFTRALKRLLMYTGFFSA